MMNSDNLHEHYSAYLDGEMPQNTLKAFESALKDNSEAQQTLERMNNLRNQLQQLPVVSTTPDFEQRLHERIQELNSRPFRITPFPESPSWRTTATATAVVVVLTFSSAIYYFGNEGDIIEGTAQPTTSTMTPTTAPGLKAATSIKMPISSQQPTELDDASQDSTDRDQRRNLKKGIQVVNENTKGN